MTFFRLKTQSKSKFTMRIFSNPQGCFRVGPFRSFLLQLYRICISTGSLSFHNCVLYLFYNVLSSSFRWRGESLYSDLSHIVIHLSLKCWKMYCWTESFKLEEAKFWLCWQRLWLELSPPAGTYFIPLCRNFKSFLHFLNFFVPTLSKSDFNVHNLTTHGRLRYIPSRWSNHLLEPFLNQVSYFSCIMWTYAKGVVNEDCIVS